MTKEELYPLISVPENAYLERKSEGANRADLRQTLVAFANSVQTGREAVLFIGIRDNGDIQGVANVDEMQKLVRAICMTDCYPPINYQPEVLNREEKSILAIVIPPSARRPHFSGPAYLRRGSESVAASPEQYEELIASRHEKCRVLQTWENKLITFLEAGFRLETGRPVNNWHAERQGFVIGCTPHTVRIRDTSNFHFTLPIHQIVISYDEKKHRGQIIIQPS